MALHLSYMVEITPMPVISASCPKNLLSDNSGPREFGEE